MMVGVGEPEDCCICLQIYHAKTNPPMRFTPCRHHVGRVCYTSMQNATHAHLARQCPTCRAQINGAQVDMSIIDQLRQEEQEAKEADEGRSSGTPDTAVRRRDREYLRDLSEFAFYGLDNSGSMGVNDGKTMLGHIRITPDSDLDEILSSSLQVRTRRSRWEELVENVKIVSLYNLRRGIRAVYMLLNPGNRSTWRRNVDFVVVDPSRPRQEQLNGLNVLFETLLSQSNVGGGTPLDLLTNQLLAFVQGETDHSALVHHELVSYNLFTDGLPTSQRRFEDSLRRLADRVRLGSITVNLTTDEDDVVEYFGDLDTTIGASTAALEGTRFDVIDDIAAEAKEVYAAGNRFVNYCLPIHVARMAGCNNPVADELDERRLPPHFVAKLCKEAMALPRTAPHHSDVDAFVGAVTDHAGQQPSFYNIRRRRQESVVDCSKLRSSMRASPGMDNPVAYFMSHLRAVLVVVLVAVLFWYMSQDNSRPSPYRR